MGPPASDHPTGENLAPHAISSAEFKGNLAAAKARKGRENASCNEAEVIDTPAGGKAAPDGESGDDDIARAVRLSADGAGQRGFRYLQTGERLGW